MYLYVQNGSEPQADGGTVTHGTGRAAAQTEIYLVHTDLNKTRDKWCPYPCQIIIRYENWSL